jgi:hypothetical protein
VNKFACRYAVVQFMPFTETGEFANVGVVLACPQTGYLDYRLQSRRHARITQFFEELDGAVYRSALKAFESELQRVANLACDADQGSRPELLRHLFTSLTHPREAMVRFGPARAILTPDPKAELQHLFDHYVGRAFATPQYIEALMTKRIGTLISSLNLSLPFRQEKIGDDAVHATFPFVQKQQTGALRKIIKPLRLDHEESNSIFEHGDSWTQKVRRLRDRGLLPADIMFAVAQPKEEDAKRQSACADILSQLQTLKVRTVTQDDEQGILAFANA